jgi:hypothetical protein
MMNETRIGASLGGSLRKDPCPGDRAQWTNRSTRLLIAVGLPILMWACGGDPKSVPAPAGSGYTVSGVVFEQTPAGTVPVEGVWVAEANSRRGAMTDRKGFYSIAGLSAGTISLSASGPSYFVSTVTVSISGNVEQDIQIIAVKE